MTGGMNLLALIRHGTSVYNERGLWTGHIDVELSKKGRDDAVNMASHLKEINFHAGHSSSLKRARETLEIMLAALGLEAIPKHIHRALIERHYGVHQGKNKWEIKKEVGEEEFFRIRRGFDHPIAGGETGRQVCTRVAAWYESEFLPKAKKHGGNHLIVAHGNSLRALVTRLEGLTPSQFSSLEFGFGEVWIYSIERKSGKVGKKVIKGENPQKGKV